GQLGLKEIYTLIPILKGLELGKLESNEIYSLIPLLKEIEQGKLVGTGIYNLTYIQDEKELDKLEKEEKHASVSLVEELGEYVVEMGNDNYVSSFL
ncbi:TPA: hypothetical protein RG708_003676, partial [Proteus mirabilis]|nr:hypothetical protein [Proteus mirabilis]